MAFWMAVSSRSGVLAPFAEAPMQGDDFRSHTNCHTKSLCSIEETFDYSLVIVWELLVGAVGLEPTTR